MAVELKDLHFEESESVTVTRVDGTTVVSPVAALDFQEKGVMVESFEPNPPSTQVRHLVFIPYSNVRSVNQSYIV